MAEEVLYEVADGVAVITFNRPEKLNAFTREMQDLYFGHLREADRDDGVKAVVVTGAGRAYCAGADFSRVEGRLDPTTRGGFKGARYLRALQIRKPTIAAVNGVCVGIAVLQACACDIRFAAAGASFHPIFARRGLSVEEGISWFLPRIVGMPNALDLLMSGRRVDAAEALAMGLVNRVCGDDVLGAARAYALDLARNCSPTSMALAKRLVYRHAAATPATALAEARKAALEAFATTDAREGMQSFRDKRPPRFPPPAAFVDLFDIEIAEE